MVGSALVDLARSRQFWHLSLAFSGDEGASFTIPGFVEYAGEQPAGLDNFATDDAAVSDVELLPYREAAHGLGKNIRLRVTRRLDR